jgi:hypothetical protein
MVSSGYNAQHVREFLANYFTYRFDTTGYGTSPAYLSAANVLTVPMGGSTISATLNAATVPVGAVDCVGTTAQPFLNEAAFKLTLGKGGATTVSDWAIELANPFPGTTALPCSNYSIAVYFGGSKTAAFTVPLTGGALTGFSTAGNRYIGVLALKGGAFYAQASADADGFLIADTDGFSIGTVVIDLVRNGVAGGSGSVVVDSMLLNIPNVPKGSPTTEYYDVSRDNGGASDGIWGCDSAGEFASPLSTTISGTIGTANGAVATGGEPGVVLYDRWYSGDLVAPGATAGNDLANINDFNCIARECSTVGTGGEPLSEQIATNIAAPPPPAADVIPDNLGMYYVAQAQALGYPVIPATAPAISPEVSESALYFDFAYDPRAAHTVADADFIDPVDTTPGEIPPTILSTTTLTDRSQSNTTAAIALPEGAADLVRQAGKININTASQAVLYSAFSENGALWNGTKQPLALDVDQLVSDAIGFRDRLAGGTTIPGLPTTVPVPNPGFNVGGKNGYSAFAGAGYQSIADLLVAFIPTVESGTFPKALKTTPTTLQQRDAAWADVENFLSVRSDTFAVYGLVQALRLNPAYSTAGGTYTPTDWYNANQGIAVGTGTVYNEGSISTDPTNQNAEFILEGTRRFMALVDRSYCNNGALVQPHIVALKILPQ